MRQKRRRIREGCLSMNLANKITVARILLTPVFVVLILCQPAWCKWAALGVFVVASATDKLDGTIARKYHMITTLGKFLDPLADKLLIAAALVCMVELGVVGSVPALIIIARELIITSFRIVAMGTGVVMAADAWGKFKTVSQITAVIALFLDTYLLHLVWLGQVFLWISVALTVISGVNYIYRNRAVFAENKA